MDAELLKAIPAGGGIVALVALVLLFLRHMNAREETSSKTMTEIVDRFSTEHAATRQAFQDQIKGLADQVIDSSRQHREEVNAVVKEYTAICRETAANCKENSLAVKGLESAVRDLQTQIRAKA